MFFFFFDRLYEKWDIQRAFQRLLVDKMLYDGYCDMNNFFDINISKEEFAKKLKNSNSIYYVLYRNSYPTYNNAVDFWNKNFAEKETENDLTDFECLAIINWVYKIIKTKDERKQFTQSLFTSIKDFHLIANKIKEENGVYYNSEKIELTFVSSVADISDLIKKYRSGNQLYFRGHSDVNYRLLPSVLRNQNLKESERDLYQSLLINCPSYFEKCQSHLDKLVEMQHYGLPTRLLDITKNPLVGAYFACSNTDKKFGELVLLDVKENEIKFPQSDTVSILASLPLFTYDEQQDFYDAASDQYLKDKQFSDKIKRLLHEVKTEKPAFLDEIDRGNLLDCFVVRAIKSNQRIIKQDGAFILCGLIENTEKTNRFRLKDNGKTVIAIIQDKISIKKELETFSITEAALFPEIETVASYLTKRYS